MAEQNRLKLELTPEALDGIYTNFSVITHTTGEFIIDFARTVPGKSVAKVYSRIIMSPINFKLFKQAVEENLDNYELKHGKINVSGSYTEPKLESSFGGNSTSPQNVDLESKENAQVQNSPREKKNNIIVEE